MAVRSISQNAYEFTANDDHLLEVVKVNSFMAITTSAGGTVNVFTKNIKIDPNGVITFNDTIGPEALVWSSGAMNANAVQESAVDIDRLEGVRVELPDGAKLILYVE